MAPIVPPFLRLGSALTSQRRLGNRGGGGAAGALVPPNFGPEGRRASNFRLSSMSFIFIFVCFCK